MLVLNSENIGVVPVSDSDMTESGLLYIPDIAKKRANQGVVKYKGHNVKDINIGDYVLFSGYTGTTVRVGNDEVIIIMNWKFVNAKISLNDPLVVPGLYFKLKSTDDGSEIYITANYESAVNLLARALEPLGRSLSINIPNPNKEDYNAE